MKLSHSALMRLGGVSGYPELDVEGICFGFSVMLALAILAKGETSFYQRLRLLEFYQSNFPKLLVNVQALRCKIMQQGSTALNEFEWLLVEVPVFFEGCFIFSKPHLVAYLFNGTCFAQSNLEKIFAMVLPKVLAFNTISIVFAQPLAFNLSDLHLWLEDLKVVLQQSNIPIPILLGNLEHCLCLKYSRIKHCWIYVDTNDFERFSENKKYYRCLTTIELAESIFNSFQDELTRHTLFRAIILAVAPSAAIRKLFNIHKQKYMLKPQHALLVNHSQLSLLHLACQKNALHDVNKLLKYSANVNQRTSSGRTPLFIASQNGNEDVVRKLLKFKAEVNLACHQCLTPLIQAAQDGHLEVVRLLVQFGALVNKQAHNGVTALYIACQNGKIGVVNELLKARARVNLCIGTGVSPLFIACQQGHLEVVRTLINASARVNQPSNTGITPLKVAQYKKHWEVATLLIRCGAKANTLLPSPEPVPKVDNSKSLKMVGLFKQDKLLNFKTASLLLGAVSGMGGIYLHSSSS